jgi:cold shock CspA family protein
MTTVGYIKFFDVRKRFGWIVPNGVLKTDKDRHVYFHEEEMDGEPKSGAIVQFSLNPNYPNPVYKNPRAEHVQLASKRNSVPSIEDRRKAVAHGD